MTRPSSRAELRRAMAQQRTELRARLRQQRQQARAELARRRQALPQQQRRHRRWRAWLLLLLLLLLVLLGDCRCQRRERLPEPPPPPAGPGGPAAGGPAPEVPAKEPRSGRIERRDRPAFEGAVPEPLPWLASFRMQVAARSPRLAECFVGIERPGALRWTTSVEPAHGRVSDHALEPVLQSDALTRPQRECVLGVLSDPPYKLESDEERSTPSRVGMVIEF